jgi:hypothetical protein
MPFFPLLPARYSGMGDGRWIARLPGTLGGTASRRRSVLPTMSNPTDFRKRKIKLYKTPHACYDQFIEKIGLL